MSTTPETKEPKDGSIVPSTEHKSKPTPWPFTASDNYAGERQITSGNLIVCRMQRYNPPKGQEEHFKALEDLHEKLVTEAGTVYHETGLTPRELVDRYKEAIEALKKIRKYAPMFGMNHKIAEVADIEINKSTE